MCSSSQINLDFSIPERSNVQQNGSSIRLKTPEHQPPPPPLKPVKRENPLGDSKSALNAAINAGGFKLKPVDHSIDHGNEQI